MARRLGADSVFTDNLECLLQQRTGWTESGLSRWRELDRRRRADPLWMWPEFFMEVVAGDGPRDGLAETAHRRVAAGSLDSGVALFLLASHGPLDAAFEMAERAIEARRFFVVDPWLDETRRFRAAPGFGALRESIGLDAEADR